MGTDAPKTAGKFAETMRELDALGDEEIKHSMADDLLCETLERLGYGEGVAVFRDMDKWYA